MLPYFQEVDRFQDLKEELKLRGYSGIWKVCTEPKMCSCCWIKCFDIRSHFTMLSQVSAPNYVCSRKLSRIFRQLNALIIY